MKLIAFVDNPDRPFYLNPDAVVGVRLCISEMGDPEGFKTIINTIDGKFVSSKLDIDTVVQLLEGT